MGVCKTAACDRVCCWLALSSLVKVPVHCWIETALVVFILYVLGCKRPYNPFKRYVARVSPFLRRVLASQGGRGFSGPFLRRSVSAFVRRSRGRCAWALRRTCVQQ